eukprot:1061969-Lingulodinium_polyedra.AAC.1
MGPWPERRARQRQKIRNHALSGSSFARKTPLHAQTNASRNPRMSGLLSCSETSWGGLLKTHYTGH